MTAPAWLGFDHGHRVLGFTGTSRGLTPAQLASLWAVLVQAASEGADRILHGCCVEADEVAAALARSLGLRLVGLPGRPVGDPMRAPIRNDTEFVVPKGPSPELTRNRRIARGCDLLVAAPETARMTVRSGSWATVRYALDAGTPVVLVLPDGTATRARAVRDEAGRVKSTESAGILWGPTTESAQLS